MATELVTAEGEVLPVFPEVRIDRRFVINRQGKEFVLSDGLLDGLHQLSGGYFSVESRIEQLPAADNGRLAVCSALVQVFDPQEPGRVLRSASGIGDAGPDSVTAMIHPHLLRMAETRAVARALRVLLNVGAVSFEELGPQGAEDTPAKPPEAFAPSRVPGSAAPRPVDHPVGGTIQIEGRTFTRAQVCAVYQDRLAEAERAGLQLAPMDTRGGPPSPSRAPLEEIVRFSTELKRRLEARAGRSTGK